MASPWRGRLCVLGQLLLHDDTRESLITPMCNWSLIGRSSAPGWKSERNSSLHPRPISEQLLIRKVNFGMNRFQVIKKEGYDEWASEDFGDTLCYSEIGRGLLIRSDTRIYIASTTTSLKFESNRQVSANPSYMLESLHNFLVNTI